MGFDISYHPISKDQMNQWFFEPLQALKNGDDSLVQKTAVEYSTQNESFFAEKYIDVMKVIASKDSKIPNEKTILYGMAVISGFFTTYQYVRGSAYSFLIEEHPEMRRYCSPWKTFLPDWVAAPEHEQIAENYSSGIYMNPSQVKDLLTDYETNTAIHQTLEDFFGSNLEVFLAALRQAAESSSGMMEASEVIEVNPFDLNNSTCYSDIMLCDPQGAFIYQKVAEEQVKAATGMDASEIVQKVTYSKSHVDISGVNESEASSADNTQDGKKKGLLARLFGKK
ncbi:hypothetical protein [Atopobium fossor]|uniref:hypothetical protein n=1 Tax=Atopobium fossor TaxID=39487 RepID=UPI00041E5E7F|nr:hypothetical protein [Atopobium fossor]